VLAAPPSGVIASDAKQSPAVVIYEQLSEKLHEMEGENTPVGIRNKVARGKFMAAFFLQCLLVIGVQVLKLEDVYCCPSLILRLVFESPLPATPGCAVGSGTVRQATQRTVARAGLRRSRGASVALRV